MKVIAFVPEVISLLLLISAVLTMKARKDPSWEKTVCFPSELFWIGFVCSFFFNGMVTYGLWNKELIIIAIEFIIFCMMCWGLEIAYINCWIQYDKHGFIHHTIFGRLYEFAYSEITGYKLGMKSRSDNFDIKLYCGNHLVFLDSMLLNRNELIESICDNYSIEETPDRISWNPYKNNRYPVGRLNYIFSVILIVFLIGVLVFYTMEILGLRVSEKNTDRREVIFVSSYEKNDAMTYLVSKEGPEYCYSNRVKIPVWPESFCDGKTVCTVWVDGNEPFEIYQFQVWDRTLYEFKQYGKTKNQDPLSPIVYLIVGFVIWMAVFTIRIGKHPERYKPRTLKFFLGEPLPTGDLKTAYTKYRQSQERLNKTN